MGKVVAVALVLLFVITPTVRSSSSEHVLRSAASTNDDSGPCSTMAVAGDGCCCSGSDELGFSSTCTRDCNGCSLTADGGAVNVTVVVESLVAAAGSGTRWECEGKVSSSTSSLSLGLWASPWASSDYLTASGSNVLDSFWPIFLFVGLCLSKF
ncbi:unnamed protein product [Linum trigynum]|uniref:Uncharacterized protein n=1 Tax=Linum trigynum TaxID=586398 RepID=A0AAV2FFY0_9ROSI